MGARRSVAHPSINNGWESPEPDPEDKGDMLHDLQAVEARCVKCVQHEASRGGPIQISLS